MNSIIVILVSIVVLPTTLYALQSPKIEDVLCEAHGEHGGVASAGHRSLGRSAEFIP